MPVARERVHSDRFNLVIGSPGYQNLRTYNILDNTVIRFEITVVARQSDGANRAKFRRIGLFYREAGGPVQLQGTQWQTAETDKSDLAFDIKFIPGSNTLAIQVKNASSTATRWVGYVDILGAT